MKPKNSKQHIEAQSVVNDPSGNTTSIRKVSTMFKRVFREAREQRGGKKRLPLYFFLMLEKRFHHSNKYSPTNLICQLILLQRLIGSIYQGKSLILFAFGSKRSQFVLTFDVIGHHIELISAERRSRI